MKHKTPLPLVSLLAVLLIAGLVGCQNQSPARRLTLLNETATLGLNVLADAKAVGLVSDAEVQQLRPLADAYIAAEREATAQIRTAEAAKAAGQPVSDTAVVDALAQANAAWAKLAPWVLEMQSRKKGQH